MMGKKRAKNLWVSGQGAERARREFFPQKKPGDLEDLKERTNEMPLCQRMGSMNGLWGMFGRYEFAAVPEANRCWIEHTSSKKSREKSGIRSKN